MEKIKVRFQYYDGEQQVAFLTLTEDQLRLLKYLNDELVAFGDGAEILEVERTKYVEV